MYRNIVFTNKDTCHILPHHINEFQTIHGYNQVQIVFDIRKWPRELGWRQVISVFLPGELRVSGDVDAVKLAVRMERAYVRPDVRALPQVVLAVRALESLLYAALVSVMSHHVTAVLITAVAVRAGMTRIKRVYRLVVEVVAL